MLDEVMLGGLGGETPLRDRKQQYIDRVVAMQDNIDGQLAASRDTKQPPSGRSGSSGGGGGGVASGGASGQQEPEPEFLVRTPSKRSGALDGELEAISLVMQKLEERGDEALLQGAKAAVEHAQGYSSSRSSLTSTGGVIGRILVALEHTVPAPRNAHSTIIPLRFKLGGRPILILNVETEQVEVRLDAVEIDDEPQHRDKKHQRKMLNRRLSDLNERLEAVNDSYESLCGNATF
jgi:hypothetical protein